MSIVFEILGICIQYVLYKKAFALKYQRTAPHVERYLVTYSSDGKDGD